MRTSRALRIALPVCAWIAAAPARVRADDGLARAIVAGEPSADDGAVVALLTSGRRLGCTGTLIRPHVVLTAAHCIDLAGGEPATAFVGPDLDVAGQGLAVVKRLAHPEFVPDALVADIGLLGIAGEFEPVPLDLVRLPPDGGVAGLEVRVVGYGCTDLADDTQGVGLRRSRLDTIDAAVDDRKLRHGDVTCRGDSGGPVLLSDATGVRVLGVTSSGGARDGQAFSLATSVPDFAAWVDAQADALEAELAPPEKPPAEGCAVAGQRAPSFVWWLLLAAWPMGRTLRAMLCRRTPAGGAARPSR